MSYTDEEKLHLGAQQAALIQLQEHQELQTKVQIQQAMLEADKEQSLVQSHVIAMPQPPMPQQFIEQAMPVQPTITQPATSMQPAPPGQMAGLPPPPGLAPPGLSPAQASVAMAPSLGPPGIMITATSISQPVPQPPPHIPPMSGPPIAQPVPLMSQTISAVPSQAQIGPPGVQPIAAVPDVPISPIQPPTSQAGNLSDDAEDPDSPDSREVKLPQALEKVLAFKDMRAMQVGVKPEDIERVEKGEMGFEGEESSERAHLPRRVPINEYADEEDEEEQAEAAAAAAKESKNKKKKKKKKKAKKKQIITFETPSDPPEPEDPVEIEYIQETLSIDPRDPVYMQFAKIFETFKIAETDKDDDKKKDDKKDDKKAEVPIKARGLIIDDDDDEPKTEKPDDDKPKISKKKLKKLSRLSVAELKQLVIRPDVVEMHDVTARDPKLLVSLKATRNTVPVPRHWCFKRKYLQGKRGIEKPPFDLPGFIKATGIMEMRAALQEKEDQRSMKQKMRERVRPKMGKIDIDYQKLHDAFFRYQSKPKMTIHGDLYYEGKEFETRLKEKKPGNLSDDLRTALGMPVGSNADKVPPPWLIAMQRYGPPPSYPNLKIPGLNAPIPDACSFGYHAGGWGKPPVDETGKPLYGDVFGTQSTDFQMPVKEEIVDRSHWGELESESESEEEVSDEEMEDEVPDTTGLITPGDPGLTTPSGLTSVPVGMETPDLIELRKRRIEDAMDQGGDTPALYTVLPEKRTAVGGAMMGSTHIYDMSAVTAGQPLRRPGEKSSAEGVEVALNPDELDMDSAAMQAKYEQTMKEQQSQLEKEDLSDMVAEHAAKQKKRKAKQQDAQKGTKKYREFKF